MHFTTHSLQSLKASTGFGKFTWTELFLGVALAAWLGSSSIHLSSALKTQTLHFNKTVSGTIAGTRVRLSKSVAVPPMNSLNLMEWARSIRHEWTLRETAWTKTTENITYEQELGMVPCVYNLDTQQGGWLQVHSHFGLHGELQTSPGPHYETPPHLKKTNKQNLKTTKNMQRKKNYTNSYAILGWQGNFNFFSPFVYKALRCAFSLMHMCR